MATGYRKLLHTKFVQQLTHVTSHSARHVMLKLHAVLPDLLQLRFISSACVYLVYTAATLS